jgi:hypothetical protein
MPAASLAMGLCAEFRWFARGLLLFAAIESTRREYGEPRARRLAENTMDQYHGDLLKPSLSPEAGRPFAAPYSTTSGFVAAFFGGPFGALVAAGMNVHRLRRWRQDAVWFAAGLLLAFAWVWLLPQAPAYPAWRSGVAEVLGRNGWHYVERALSLALFLVACARHRQIERAADLFGLPRPNGWIGGIAATVAGFVLHVLVAAAVPT